jgi:hypothetical protein
MGIEADRHVEAHTPSGPFFWVCVLVGWAVMGFGIVGALDNATFTHPRSFAIWVVGSLAVHDLVIAPLVFLTGGALHRIVPSMMRGAVQTATILSALFVALSIPIVGAFGARPDNPTLLPRNAAVGLLLCLGTVWAFAATVGVVAWRRHARRR